MALETKCLTPDAIYHTAIVGNKVSVEVSLPFELDVTEEEAEILDRLMHNQLELVLRSYFLLDSQKNLK